jgi:nitrogen fixation protein
MPIYTFRNKKTGEEFDEQVKMDDKDAYMKKHGLEQIITTLNMVHQAGNRIPVDNGFREVQDKIAQTHTKHNMNRH